MKYENRADISTKILKIADKDVSKTKIMYGAFLSFAQLKEYLKILVDNGALSFDERTTHYRTTEVGRDSIKTYERGGPDVR